MEVQGDKPGLRIENIFYGRVLDPGKFPDPKMLGRVKVRIPELHGKAETGGIPDQDLPWCQIERSYDLGNQQEMSSFSMPQNDSIVKCRFQGNDYYSPLVSGAPYTVDGPISEFGGADPNSALFGEQHKHLGYKDALGGIVHFDMAKKEILIDWTKYKKIHVKWPKTIFEILNTFNDDSYPPDGYSGSGWGDYSGGSDLPSDTNTTNAPRVQAGVPFNEVKSSTLSEVVSAQRFGANTPAGGGGGDVPGDCPQTAMNPESVTGSGPEIRGDINWIIEGYFDQQTYGTYNNHARHLACDTFDSDYHLTVGGDWYITIYGSVIWNVSANFGLGVGGSMNETIGGTRNTSVGGQWTASAAPTYWGWLSVRYADISGTDLDD
jgi:hypothetical protein